MKIPAPKPKVFELPTPKPMSDPAKFLERSTAAAERDRLGIIRELATAAFIEDAAWSGFAVRGVASDHLTVIDEDGQVGRPGDPYILQFEQAQNLDIVFGPLYGPGEFVHVPAAKAAATVETIKKTDDKPEPPRDPFRVETDPKKVAERDRVARAEASAKAAMPKEPVTGIFRGARGTAIVRKTREEFRGGADPKDPRNPFRVPVPKKDGDS